MTLGLSNVYHTFLSSLIDDDDNHRITLGLDVGQSNFVVASVSSHWYLASQHASDNPAYISELPSIGSFTVGQG
jgi:molecular chaperone DnaK (HSP70)